MDSQLRALKLRLSLSLSSPIPVEDAGSCQIATSHFTLGPLRPSERRHRAQSRMELLCFSKCHYMLLVYDVLCLCVCVHEWFCFLYDP